MVYTRSNNEIEMISKSCQIVADTLEMISDLVVPGVLLSDLDKKAENFIVSTGARPAFKGYMGFPSTLCVSIEDAVVHGIPGDNILSKVTFPGSVALAVVAIFPYILMQAMDVEYDLASFFGGTSLLIIVGVALDTLQQLESHLMMRHYDGFLSKGKIRGRRRM